MLEVKMHYVSNVFALFTITIIAKYKPLQEIVYDWSKIRQSFATWFI